MALLDFYIRNQKLSKIGPKIVSGSIKYVDCSFTFKTDDWIGMDKWVVFEKGSERYQVTLINDSIPGETGLSLGAGIWHVSLFGENAKGTRITTNSVTVEVEQGAVPEGGSLPEISLSEAEQISAKAQNALNRSLEAEEKANAVFEAAERGDFKGEKGDPGEVDYDSIQNYIDNAVGGAIGGGY